MNEPKKITTDVYINSINNDFLAFMFEDIIVPLVGIIVPREDEEDICYCEFG